MKINLYHVDEISEKSALSIQTINDWIGEGILIPEGFAENNDPILSDESLKTVEKITSLLQLGYDLEEIKKIIRKVGLPDSGNKTNIKSGNRENYLTVGSLAEKTGVSTRTIKHWEEKGIIEPDLRSAGGFRLYRDYYILFCNLIKDLQLFGYSLEEIKTISDYFRSFIELKDFPENFSSDEIEHMVKNFEEEITNLFKKTEMLKKGIKRWEDLLKKQKKQISAIKERNRKRTKENA